MELSILLAQQIVSMFLIVVLGYLLYNRGFFNQEATAVLARLNLNVVCPCAIFYSFQMEFTMEKLTGLLVAIFASLVIHLLFIGMERILRRPLKLRPVESASIIYTNGLNLILPLVMAALSEDMVFYCSAFCIVQTFLLWTHCKILISGERTINVRTFLNPNLVGIALGLIFYVAHLSLPSILATSVKNIGSMVGPLSMLVIGLLMGPLDLKKAFGNPRVYLVTGLRLILLPLLTVLVLRYSGMLNLHPMADQIYIVTIMAAASCSAASVPQMAQVYDNEANYASMLNVSTLAFCIITMPLMIFLFQVLNS